MQSGSGEECASDAMDVAARPLLSMLGPLTETTGSEGEDAVEAPLEKPLTAEEYAQVALEKLFASPLFASSVCSLSSS